MCRIPAGLHDGKRHFAAQCFNLRPIALIITAMHHRHRRNEAARCGYILPAVLQGKCSLYARHGRENPRCIRLRYDRRCHRVLRKQREDVICIDIAHLKARTILAHQVFQHILRLLALSDAQHLLPLEALEAGDRAVSGNAVKIIATADIHDHRVVLRGLIGPGGAFR